MNDEPSWREVIAWCALGLAIMAGWFTALVLVSSCSVYDQSELDVAPPPTVIYCGAHCVCNGRAAVCDEDGGVPVAFWVET